MAKPKLIVIVGTNASGKSGLGVELAKKYGGEIVSADSRQVFEGLNLGSGKITAGEMRGVPHHLLDIIKPGEFFSMADFQRLAYAAIDDIVARGKLPFLVGGTGLYVDSVADGYRLSDKVPDLTYRAELETLTTEALYYRLHAERPDIEVDRHNRNRVMRVLERLKADDYHPAQKESRYETLRLGVTWEREELKRRIDERLSRRFEEGMLEEVQGLLDAGISREFLLGLGLEYRMITEYLVGEIKTRQEMETLLGNAIKKFAKRQMTWFRRDKSIHWLDMTGEPVTQACGLIEGFLQITSAVIRGGALVDPM